MSESVRTKPAVVNVSKLKAGWKKDPQNVDVRRMRNGRVNPNVGAVGYFGNPYKIGADKGDGSTIGRDDAIAYFRTYAAFKVATDPTYRKAVRDLEGKNLVCCCAPEPCHADVLAEFCMKLNREENANV